MSQVLRFSSVLVIVAVVLCCSAPVLADHKHKKPKSPVGELVIHNETDDTIQVKVTDANGGAIGGGWTFKPGEVAHLEIDDKDVYVDGDYLVSTGSGLKPISVVGFFEGGNWHVRYVEDHED